MSGILGAFDLLADEREAALLGAPRHAVRADAALMRADVRPSHWHESWLRYSEFDGKACILHTDVTDVSEVHLCVVRLPLVPSGMHGASQFTDEYALRFRAGAKQSWIDDIEGAVEAWEREDARLRGGEA